MLDGPWGSGKTYFIKDYLMRRKGLFHAQQFHQPVELRANATHLLFSPAIVYVNVDKN
jgi:hypothetical protein